MSVGAPRPTERKLSYVNVVLVEGGRVATVTGDEDSVAILEPNLVYQSQSQSKAKNSDVSFNATYRLHSSAMSQVGKSVLAPVDTLGTPGLASEDAFI